MHTDSRFDPPTQTPVPHDNPLKGLIEAFDAERARIEAQHDDRCYCMGGAGPHPYHGTPR
jgi:hypothetical protein